MRSSHAIFLIAYIWLFLGSLYYPKWKNSYTEAAISWDVSGYYHYLPAIFIYKDLKRQVWMDSINQKYLPSAAYDQAFVHAPTGHKVMKYAIGQAVLYTPFFLAGHAYALLADGIPADGYSRPYQVAIWLGGLLVSILGLVLLRRVLLEYFDDRTTMYTLLALGLGTHWMEYAAITNGMNHSWLFTLLCGLILFTIRFYRRSDWLSAVGIGATLGLAILTRPTELVWALVPLLWGITSLKDRSTWLLQRWKKCLVAVIVCGLVLGIQPLYWKYVSGEWIVYTYRDQGFNWLKPAIWRGFVGVNIGWWPYTPLMLIAMAGWAGLYRTQRPVFWPVVSCSVLAVYLTMAWGHFESGGGLGQRNLIQAYPLMAFPLAALIAWFCRKKTGHIAWLALLALNIYYSGWWVHHAHRGGFFHAGQMKTKYFYSVAGRLNPDRDLFKLLDTKEYFRGNPQDLEPFFHDNFERSTTTTSQDTMYCTHALPAGGNAVCLNPAYQYYGPVILNIDARCRHHEWIRLEADFMILTREWNHWQFAQWILSFYDGETLLKSNMIKPHRFIPKDHQWVSVSFDTRLPEAPFDRCTMTLWNAGSQSTLLFDNLKASCFRGN